MDRWSTMVTVYRSHHINCLSHDEFFLFLVPTFTRSLAQLSAFSNRRLWWCSPYFTLSKSVLVSTNWFCDVTECTDDTISSHNKIVFRFKDTQTHLWQDAKPIRDFFLFLIRFFHSLAHSLFLLVTAHRRGKFIYSRMKNLLHEFHFYRHIG